MLLAGVCGGIAEFLGWPSRTVRGLWVGVTILTGLAPGFVVYTVLALVMPGAETPPPGFHLEDFRQQ